MSIEWEQYRERFLANRPETFDAYVDVWQRMPDARRSFTSWADFSQCASAEPKRRRDQSARVATAEDIMQRAGYRIGPTTSRGARRWFRTRSGPA
jgi:hypothetical protein